MKVLVDSDFLSYSCGFASQRTAYDYTVEIDGDLLSEGIVSTRDELDAIEAMKPEGSTLHINTVIEAEPLVNALAMCKRTLLNIESAMDEAHLAFDRLDLFLTGKGNYRNEIATIRGYKANRVGTERPVHYKAIRRYMVERWNAAVVDGYEADDAVSIIAASYNYDPEAVCIVSVDKDLMTVPGRLYNFRKKTMRIITPEEAYRAFYRQMLTGDVVDNILGCFRAGEKKALTIVPDTMNDPVDMYRGVLGEFKASMSRAGCPYSHMSPEAVVLETGRLLHMQRKVGELWEPPA
jgi:hypothetical protein